MSWFGGFGDLCGDIGDICGDVCEDIGDICGDVCEDIGEGCEDMWNTCEDSSSDLTDGISATIGGKTYNDIFSTIGSIAGGGWGIAGKVADVATKDVNIDLDKIRKGDF